MTWHDVSQDSQEWHELRLGIPTASEFHRILTPKKLTVSSQAQEYMYRLLAEWVTGSELPSFESEYMLLAKENEPRARKAYEMLTGSEVSAPGFFTTDDGLIGASPDGLIGTSGDLEIKCPAMNTHLRYALEGPGDDYRLQLQGRLMVHGREWIDFFSWHPLLTVPPRRFYRDEKTIDLIRCALATFVECLLDSRMKLEREFGPFVRVREAIEAGDQGITESDVDAYVAHLNATEGWARA